MYIKKRIYKKRTKKYGRRNRTYRKKKIYRKKNMFIKKVRNAL